jgi:pimeloyl-ACP methyl ester carboxylesterase
MEGRALSADGIPIVFEMSGAGTPTLVFVHGWSCDRSYWTHQVTAFVDRHEVVTIDLAGHGDSGVSRAEWTMPAFGEDVVAVADQLRLDRMVLIGHSMGGDVIVEAARRLPGRVIGLVWVDAYRTLGEPRSDEELATFLAQLRADYATTTRDLVRQMFLPTSDKSLVEWVAADMAAAPPEIGIGAAEHARTFEPSLILALSELQMPVVAINPDDGPSDIEALRRHGVRTVLMPGVGHFAMLEDPSAFNRLLDETIREITASATATG